MEKGEYGNPDEFEADMRFILANCYTYNPPEHEVVKMGMKLQVEALVCGLVCTSLVE